MNDKWQSILNAAVCGNVSDIHVAAGQRVFFRQDGKLFPADLDIGKFGGEFVATFLTEVLSSIQQENLSNDGSTDFSFAFGRRFFRGSAYMENAAPALMLRLIPDKIPAVDELGDANILHRLAELDEGLILVTGRTGSGKSTTLAALTEKINKTRSAHILTLEDPIEYVFAPQKSFISQREYGRDFFSFATALKAALREMPDIILIGEIRDATAMRVALSAAESGILVLGTLHTKSAAETITRVEGMFATNERDMIRSEFADAFAAVLAQRLVPAKTGGRLCAMEILTTTPATRNIIREGKYNQLPSTILSGQKEGMQTMENSLRNLYRRGLI